MRKTKLLRVITALAAAVMLTAAFSVPASAFTDETAEETPIATPEPTPEPTPAIVYEPKPLTPDGNLTLADDISGAQGADKQFITVITKSGNYFYIVIDRAGDKENVHFLNLVDEADLLALIEDKKQAAPATVTATQEPEQTQAAEPTPEPQKKNNAGGIVIMLVLIAALGGGAFYYFKVLKPKHDQNKGDTGVSALDEFAFDGDEDDLDGAGRGEFDGYAPEFETEDAPEFEDSAGFAETETSVADFGGEQGETPTEDIEETPPFGDFGDFEESEGESE